MVLRHRAIAEMLAGALVLGREVVPIGLSTKIT